MKVRHDLDFLQLEIGQLQHILHLSAVEDILQVFVDNVLTMEKLGLVKLGAMEIVVGYLVNVYHLHM